MTDVCLLMPSVWGVLPHILVDHRASGCGASHDWGADVWVRNNLDRCCSLRPPPPRCVLKSLTVPLPAGRVGSCCV